MFNVKGQICKRVLGSSTRLCREEKVKSLMMKRIA